MKDKDQVKTKEELDLTPLPIGLVASPLPLNQKEPITYSFNTEPIYSR